MKPVVLGQHVPGSVWRRDTVQLSSRRPEMCPLQHWLIIFRAILLKGAGIEVFWRELLAIAGLGTVIYSGTILLLRRTRLE